jgi:predicted transcriptional regulator
MHFAERPNEDRLREADYTGQGVISLCPASTVVTRDVALCWGPDHLEYVSELLKQRHLKNIPVVDTYNWPIGIVTARLILQALLGDAEHEEVQLSDFIDGVGYR